MISALSRFIQVITVVELCFLQITLGCTEVNYFRDIQTAVQSSETNIILLCPFSITNVLSDEEHPIKIEKEGTRLICSKTDVGDKCELFGTGRHIDISADDVTLFGFDINGSINSAISVINGKGTTFLDCNFRNNDSISTESESGGSIVMSTAQNRNVLVFGSHFQDNKARNGGAIYGSDITIISSVFQNNVADEANGGAVFLQTGYIRSSNFTSNDAEKNGPAIYSEKIVCDAGMNHACHFSFYQNNTCDGISSKNGRCVQFASTCNYGSVSPSTTPTMYPSLLQSTHPSLGPSSHPSSKTSSFPSSRPTPHPSSFLSMARIDTSTKAPSRHVSTRNPFPSLAIPSKSPTVVHTLKPYTTQYPTIVCSTDKSLKSHNIHKYLPNVNETETGTLQSDVIEWLLTVDTLSYCPEEEIIVQRYAAAVITKTFSPDTELTFQHECNWDGFLCNKENQIVSFVKIGGKKHQLPEELSMLKNLRQILVKKGEITGGIPPAIFELPSLIRLDLDKQDMSGIIEVNNESALQRLDINFNNFTGSIDFLTSFPNIIEAHLDNNNFSGEIPDALGQLKNLHILTLHGNLFKGTMPQSICDLRRNHNLKYLMADCDGPSPKVFCECCTHCNPY